MQDYTLAIGNGDPYGFSARDDRAAMVHAADYIQEHGQPAGLTAVPVVLSGPGGLLTLPTDDTEAFCRRTAIHRTESTDDVRPADPTPPDCNMA